MDIRSLIKNNRSYRRFDGSYEIKEKILFDLVDLVRYTSSSKNIQPLRFFLSADKPTNEEIFNTLAWAGYLKDWDGPSENERPSAYIVVVVENEMKDPYTLFNAGLAVQSILLGAVDKGLGGCIIGAVKKDKLKKIIHLNDKYEIICVIALGKPVEKVVIENMKDNDVKYWRDPQGTHHVPKRKLEDIVLN